jgi:hypothetical protein
MFIGDHPERNRPKKLFFNGENLDMFVKLVKGIVVCLALIAVLVAFSGPVLADDNGWGGHGGGNGGGNGGMGNGGGAVPELSPGIILSVMALSAGGVLLLTDRFRKS